jgi:hypothetical protein
MACYGVMEQKRFYVMRSACTRVLLLGPPGGEAVPVARRAGAGLPPATTIERTDTGVLCVRTRLVPPPRRLVAASATVRNLVIRQRNG